MSTDPPPVHVLKRIAENSVREKFKRDIKITVLSFTWWKGKLRLKWFRRENDKH